MEEISQQSFSTGSCSLCECCIGVLCSSVSCAKLCCSGAEGVPKDTQEGVDMLQEAAEGGNAEAAYIIGKAYANGEGVRASEFAGKRWLKAAAKTGHEGAVEELKRHFWS